MLLSRRYAEKRNFKRLGMNCPVSFQVEDSPNRKMGTCLNLSADGILLQCDDNYPLGTKISISVIPELSISPSFSAMMEVVRVRAARDKEGYQIGGVLEGIH